MSRIGCVMIWVGMLCVGVASVTAIDRVNGVGRAKVDGGVKTTSFAATHVNFQLLDSCRRLSSLLQLLKSAIDDLHAVQRTVRSQRKFLRKEGSGKVKVRARQWAKKLQRRLLRLCPRQTAALLTPVSRATRKQWAVAGGEYLRAVALHGERPARGLPLRRQKLSHLLDILMSLFSTSQQSTTTTPAFPIPEGQEESVQIDNGLEESVLEEESVVKDAVEVIVGVQEMLREVPDVFLSLALSPRLMQRGWLNFNTSSPRLLGIVSALSPAILRVGGSAANFVTYDPRDTPTSGDNENGGHGAGGQETEGQEGTADNQEVTDEEGFRSRCYDREFSTPTFTNFTITQPNSYKHKFGIVMSGEQTARDYGVLSKILKETCPSAPLAGPDVTRPKKHHDKRLRSRHHHRHHRQRHSNTTRSSPEGAAGVGTDAVDYLESFLNASTFNLSALTWHQYYVSGHEAVVADFMDPDVMNQLTWQVEQVVAVRDRLAPGRPIWLTETGSASGGGAPDMSDTFVGGFLWLDKLGVAAEGGVDVVTRQTLYESCYALLDPDLQPNPDYWLSLLYKRIVGRRVLRVHIVTPPRTLRLYAHCLHPHAHGTNDTEGGVVVLAMNLGSRTVSVRLQDEVAASPVLQYLLQPSGGDIQARQVLLNGNEIQLGPDGELPPLPPTVLLPGPFSVPPASFGFWVLPRAVPPPACRREAGKQSSNILFWFIYLFSYSFIVTGGGKS
ncbi:hyaluronoglucuronidase-like isoform X2 [Portunus trituberculatus]|uniref:hyaluronoglucuronidase-like isoform X2 n=1 Tax=Portunus trituberculatus TaxID=210409 RepID=UPI001E1D1109|nr:hyaluronoglucuronidase-like isoform X2 [Portunus trituberculatus]